MASKASTASVKGGLATRNNLKGGLSLTLAFEPTIGIAARRIDKLGVDIRSFRVPLHKSVKDVVAPSIRRNFDAGGRPRWDDLSGDTLKIKARYGFSTAPLIRTGALRRIAGQINIWTITTDTAIVKSLRSAAYGGIHQSGTSGGGGGGGAKRSVASLRDKKRRGRTSVRDRSISREKVVRMGVTIPQRQFLLIQDEDRSKIEKIFIDWLDDRIRRARI